MPTALPSMATGCALAKRSAFRKAMPASCGNTFFAAWVRKRMGKASRDKGANYERELVNAFKDRGLQAQREELERDRSSFLMRPIIHTSD